MRNYTITLDSELGLRLGLTSADFEDAFIWDCRPKCLGVIRLKPRSKEALRNFFELGSKIHSVIEICCPLPDVLEMSKEYNYEYKVDVAGTPYVTDEKLKRK